MTNVDFSEGYANCATTVHLKVLRFEMKPLVLILGETFKCVSVSIIRCYIL